MTFITMETLGLRICHTIKHKFAKYCLAALKSNESAQNEDLLCRHCFRI